jgi:ATP-dependent DNA helicase RecG
MLYMVQLVQSSKKSNVCRERNVAKEILLYPERESKNLEFKSNLPQFNVLIKTCVAFANGFGGQIIVGVDDKTKQILGITDKDRDRIYDEFPNSLYDSVSPTLMVRIWEKRFNDLSVLIIDIAPSPKKPYFIKSEGMPKGVYVRIGSSTRRANDDYVEELVRERQRITYDEEPIRQSYDILSRDLLRAFYGGAITEKRLFADKVVLLSNEGKDRCVPTVAGVLFFCQDPHVYIPEATILCTCFKGDEVREIIHTKELTGTIDGLANQAYDLVSSWLETGYRLEKVFRKRQTLIPEKALREAIVNALIHRKYSIPGAIKIAVFDNRCEIFNPGAFPGVVDVTNLGDGTTYLRNPVIAKIARKMGLAEKLGSGIRLIFDSIKKAGLRKPEYHEEGDFVKVVFFFEPDSNPNLSSEEAILNLIKMKGELTNKDVVNHLKVSRNTATRKLSVLSQEGKLIRRGKGSAVRYYLV